MTTKCRMPAYIGTSQNWLSEAGFIVEHHLTFGNSYVEGRIRFVIKTVGQVSTKLQLSMLSYDNDVMCFPLPYYVTCSALHIFSLVSLQVYPNCKSMLMSTGYQKFRSNQVPSSLVFFFSFLNGLTVPIYRGSAKMFIYVRI